MSVARYSVGSACMWQVVHSAPGLWPCCGVWQVRQRGRVGWSVATIAVWWQAAQARCASAGGLCAAKGAAAPWQAAQFAEPACWSWHELQMAAAVAGASVTAVVWHSTQRRDVWAA